MAANGGFGQFETGRKVNVQNQLPVFVAHADKQVVAGQAGIINQNVNAAKLFLNLRNQIFNVFGISQIGGKNFDAVAEFGLQLFHRFGTHVGQRQRCALFMQRTGNFVAQTAGGAGNKSYFIV